MTCGLVPLTFSGPPGPFGVEMLTPCSRMHRAKLTSCCSLFCELLALALEPEPPHAASARLASAHEAISGTVLIGKCMALLSRRRSRRRKIDAHITPDAAESSLRAGEE